MGAGEAAHSKVNIILLDSRGGESKVQRGPLTVHTPCLCELLFCGVSQHVSPQGTKPNLNHSTLSVSLQVPYIKRG